MKRTCNICGKEFEGYQKTCSKECLKELRKIQLEERWKNAEYRNHITEKSRESAKKQWEDPMIREKMTAAISDAMNTDEYKANHKAACDNIEYKQKISESSKKRCKDFTYRKQMSINAKKNWDNDDYRSRVIEGNKQTWTPERRKRNAVILTEHYDADKHSEKMKNNWKDSEFAHKMLTSGTKYKEYTTPSGRVIKLQGYELQVLSELLKTYSEDDIVIGVKEMNAAIGKIQYMYEGNLRTYYPDFYIKSTNTIIEVKSRWTFEANKEKNLAKEQACLQQGFNFEFRILK